MASVAHAKSIDVGLTTTVVEVTPEIAEEWLKTMVKNRQPRERQVAKLAADMAAGDWVLNGETIVFDREGHLVDGQHRLIACTVSRKPFLSLVVRGVETPAFATIDTGRSRTLADLLRIQGEKAAPNLAAAVRLSWMWAHGYLAGGRRTPALTNTQAVAWLDAHPRLRDAINHGGGRMYRKPVRLTHSVATSFYYFAADHVGADVVDVFVDDVMSGENLSGTDGALRLRDYLIKQQALPTRLPQRRILAMTLKAWNAWITDAEVLQLSWRTKKSGEPFPQLLDENGEPYDFTRAVEVVDAPGLSEAEASVALDGETQAL